MKSKSEQFKQSSTAARTAATTIENLLKEQKLRDLITAQDIKVLVLATSKLRNLASRAKAKGSNCELEEKALEATRQKRRRDAESVIARWEFPAVLDQAALIVAAHGKRYGLAELENVVNSMPRYAADAMELCLNRAREAFAGKAEWDGSIKLPNQLDLQVLKDDQDIISIASKIQTLLQQSLTPAPSPIF